MTALLPSTIDTDSLTDFLSTTALEIGVRATCEGDAEQVLLAADRVERALTGLQAHWLKIAETDGVVAGSGARNLSRRSSQTSKVSPLARRPARPGNWNASWLMRPQASAPNNNTVNAPLR